MVVLGPDTYRREPWFQDETTPEQEGIIPLNNLATRLGVAWDVRGDRRWALKAGYGRFYQRIAGTDIGVARQSRQGTLTYDWIDRNNDRVYQPGEQGTLRADSRPVTFGRIDDDVKMAYTDAFNVGFDMQLSPNFGLSVTGTFKRERDFRSTVDLVQAVRHGLHARAGSSTRSTTARSPSIPSRPSSSRCRRRTC